MQPQPYELMSDLELLALCVWREARGEKMMGKRAVAWVVRNRIARPCWWGHDYHTVILHPYQFSSFNAPPRTKITDPNESKWPEDNEADELDSIDAAMNAFYSTASADVTNGAVYYYSPPVKEPPVEWGKVFPAASIGNLSLWRDNVTQIRTM